MMDSFVCERDCTGPALEVCPDSPGMSPAQASGEMR